MAALLLEARRASMEADHGDTWMLKFFIVSVIVVVPLVFYGLSRLDKYKSRAEARKNQEP